MIRLPQLIRSIAALGCLGAALLLMARTGLPDSLEPGDRFSRNGFSAALAIGSPAPPFQLMNTSGKQITLDGATEKVTVINYWATYCAPCRQEMRDLQRLHERHADFVRVLAINLGEPAERVAGWKRELGLGYHLLLDPALAVARRYAVRGLPTTYLLDSSQRIRRVYYGPVSLDQLAGDIQRLASRA